MRDKYTQISPTHFINETTGEEFKVGQTIYLRPDYAIGNSSALKARRRYEIKGFHVTDQEPYNAAKPMESNNGKSFEFVYVCHEVSESHLNWIMTEDVDPKFRTYVDDNQIQSPIINAFREYYQKNFVENKSKKYYILT